MKFNDYLKKHQPIYYRILERSFSHQKMSHSYLFVGNQTEEAVEFLCESLVCKQSALACENCSECERMKKKIYPNYISFDGIEQSIKKQDVEHIQSEFAKTGLEDNVKIYVLKNIEKSSTTAMNALLKFLEEPAEDVYAILTTKNLNKVLPTIQSRCQIIRLLPESKDAMKAKLINEDISQEDANIAVQLYADFDEALAFVTSEDYDYLKQQVFYFIEDLYKKKENLLFNQSIAAVKKYSKNRQMMMNYLNMLVYAMMDMFHVKHQIELNYSEHKEFFQKLPKDDTILEKIEIILNTIYNIDTNANVPLAIDGMIYQLVEGS